MDDILKALRSARALMNRMGPFPIAIWVVDRPDLLRAALTLREYGSITDPPPMFYMGIPVREWRNLAATEEQYHHFPWFVRLPGVWLEMSDYQHKQVQL